MQNQNTRARKTAKSDQPLFEQHIAHTSSTSSYIYIHNRLYWRGSINIHYRNFKTAKYHHVPIYKPTHRRVVPVCISRSTGNSSNRLPARKSLPSFFFFFIPIIPVYTQQGFSRATLLHTRGSPCIILRDSLITLPLIRAPSARPVSTLPSRADLSLLSLSRSFCAATFCRAHIKHAQPFPLRISQACSIKACRRIFFFFVHGLHSFADNARFFRGSRSSRFWTD